MAVADSVAVALVLLALCVIELADSGWLVASKRRKCLIAAEACASACGALAGPLGLLLRGMAGEMPDAAEVTAWLGSVLASGCSFAALVAVLLASALLARMLMRTA